MKNESLLLSRGSHKIERIVQLRVKEGADLLGALKEAADQEKIRSAVIMSGLGALNRAVFRNLKVFPKRFPVQRKDRIYLEIGTPMELVSLGGWIAAAQDGRSYIHAHFSASTVVAGSVETMGGHLTQGTIAGIKVVVAIAVLEADMPLAAFDQSTQSMEITFPVCV